MKYKALQLIVALVLLAVSIKAQNLIAVQNGGEAEFYLQVDDAIINSQDGDTIYIPGGSWNITQPINKRLHIIGVGHNPDSTFATFSTTLIGDIKLIAGASNGTLTGIYLNGKIIGTGDPVNSYIVMRCNISSFIYLFQSNSNFIFIDNILEGFGDGSNGIASNCSFFNNIISLLFYYTAVPYVNSIFKNNIFLNQSNNGYLPIVGQYLVFENNISLGYCCNFSYVNNSTARNNLFVESFSFPIGTNVGSNNIVGQAHNSIFINQNGNVFNYDHDYHLQSTCPGKNAGTDGTDVGIYGGAYPWKEGSIPFNPHYQSVNIPGTTDQNGNLNVNIKVAAQDY